MTIEAPKSRLDAVKQLHREGKLDSLLPREGRFVVSVDRLIEDPKNERKTFRNMEGLIASIQSMGIIEPLTVMPADGGRYQIVTGHRRFRAAREAELKEIEVIIRDAENEKRVRQKSVVSNVQRENVNPIELAEALQSLLDDSTVESQRELARIIGKDETWVSHMLALLKLPTKLRRKLETSQVTLPYDAAAKVARHKNPAEQFSLVEDLLRGATSKQIREKIGTLTGRKKTVFDGQPKPKQAYHTNYGTTVVVQSQGDELTAEQVVLSLRHALAIAEKRVEVEAA
ncbi:MAG: ParB/RepB/Spo0J family partition protein [Planctomycetaceae bacterium]|nr:ParB/RepB/Spo0J family partition protein [Planctomycetaceae bacterium]